MPETRTMPRQKPKSTSWAGKNQGLQIEIAAPADLWAYIEAMEQDHDVLVASSWRILASIGLDVLSGMDTSRAERLTAANLADHDYTAVRFSLSDTARIRALSLRFHSDAKHTASAAIWLGYKAIRRIKA